MVPAFTMCRSTREMPSFVPAASPRLRRRPSPWPPHRWNYTASELTTGHNPVRTSRAAHRPISTRLEPTSLLRSVNRWFTLVTPSGLAKQARTVWQSRHVPPLSGPLAALPGVPPGQAAPRLHPAAATAGRERSLTPPRSPRRLVAHNSAAKKLAADLKIWFARRSSRFSRSSRATRSASLDVVPGRSPASISARLPQAADRAGRHPGLRQDPPRPGRRGRRDRTDLPRQLGQARPDLAVDWRHLLQAPADLHRR